MLKAKTNSPKSKTFNIKETTFWVYECHIFVCWLWLCGTVMDYEVLVTESVMFDSVGSCVEALKQAWLWSCVVKALLASILMF